jgi:hypothetical protein
LNVIAHSGLSSSGPFEKNRSKPYKKGMNSNGLPLDFGSGGAQAAVAVADEIPLAVRQAAVFTSCPLIATLTFDGFSCPPLSVEEHLAPQTPSIPARCARKPALSGLRRLDIAGVSVGCGRLIFHIERRKMAKAVLAASKERSSEINAYSKFRK